MKMPIAPQGLGGSGRSIAKGITVNNPVQDTRGFDFVKDFFIYVKRNRLSRAFETVPVI